MEPIPKYSNIDSVLQKFDRSSPEKLLTSIAQEILLINQQCRYLEAKVVAMETLQKFVDRIANDGDEAKLAALPEEFLISADQAIPGSWGFYQLEYEADGTPFRWTGPEETFSFQFFLNRQAISDFVLQFGRICSGAPIEGIRCLVDGAEVPIKVSPILGSFEIVGQLPIRRNSAGSVLTFICPAMISPNTIEASDDNRLLGMSFRSLKIKSRLESQRRSITHAGDSKTVSLFESLE